LPPDLGDDSIRWVRKPFEVGEIVAALAESRAAASGSGRGVGIANADESGSHQRGRRT
jgi:hypothetical protein